MVAICVWQHGVGDAAFAAAVVLGGWADTLAVDAMRCCVAAFDGVTWTTMRVPGGCGTGVLVEVVICAEAKVLVGIGKSGADSV
jgi:hypothetical protein